MRLIIFSVLGPLIGLISFHLWTWATAKGAGPYPLWPWDVPLMLFGAYLVGFIPAWFTGAADWFFASRMDGWRRVLATGGAGYLITALVGLLAAASQHVEMWRVLVYGFAGVLPAVVCSWLAGRVEAYLNVAPDSK